MCWNDCLECPELWFWVTDNDLGVHRLTSLVESGSGVERRNSSRAISAADILSRATAWRVFSAQCSPNMARLKSASARRRCCSCFTDSSDRPWRWRAPKHRHKYWDGQHNKLEYMAFLKHWTKIKQKGRGYRLITQLHVGAVVRCHHLPAHRQNSASAVTTTTQDPIKNSAQAQEFKCCFIKAFCDSITMETKALAGNASLKSLRSHHLWPKL